MTVSFPDSDAGKFALLAKAFFEGALTLKDAMPSKGKVLFVPTLNLAAHGLELMLKAALLHNGRQPPTRGRPGHDIIGMWNEKEAEPVRCGLRRNAKIVHQIALHEAVYKGVAEVTEPAALAEEYVKALGELHGALTSYPLRYPESQPRLAPRAPLLVDALHRTADDFVKRPSEFLI
jgi:hypothetical protein